MSRKPTQSEWAEISLYFETLVDLPLATREGRLVKLPTDPFVINELRSLLDAEALVGVLDVPTMQAFETVDKIEYASLAPGTVIGGFCIERLIGRGGMGEVYLANRKAASFSQRVALKLLRPEAAGRISMFDTERRMLAGLEHPGIARLIDGGVAPDGRPYMALEYVEGREISAWCSEEQCVLSDRLKLFIELCNAVEYAHAHLVLHLDLKPSNVMIDSDGRVRLLDFGVAQIIDFAALDRTMTQSLLTPDYAAPEQFGGARPTVATDVYSLGAVLFELLAGRGPWHFDNAPLPTVLRRLLHDDPEYPSRAIVNDGVASQRLKGDLDAIVLKAMRRNPVDRYTNVAALANDVSRHLAFKPVTARAGTTGYRVSRFVRRNRWSSALSGIALLALVAGVSGVLLQSFETARERDAARMEAGRVEAVNQAIMLMFRDASDSSRLDAISVGQMIDDTTLRLANSNSLQSANAASTVGALADLFQLVENTTDAKKLLTTSLQAGVGRGDPVGLARLQQKLAVIMIEERRFNDARHMLAAAQVIWSSDPILFRRDLVELAGAEAYMLRLQGKRAEGIAILMANMPEAERAYVNYSRDLAARYATLVTHLVESNRLTDADRIVRRGKVQLARLGQQRSSESLTMLRLQAGVMARRGNYDGAADVLKRVVTDRRKSYGRSVALAVDLLHYARALLMVGREREALIAIDSAIPMSIELAGVDAQPTALMTLVRVEALLALGKVSAAEKAFEEYARLNKPRISTPVLAGSEAIVAAILAYRKGDVVIARSSLNSAKSVFADFRDGIVDHARAIPRLEAAIRQSEINQPANGLSSPPVEPSTVNISRKPLIDG